MNKIYYCSYCNEIYDNITVSNNQTHIFCPKGSCPGSLIEADENIIYILQILDSKGYITSSHCAGHAYRAYDYDSEGKIFCGTYITFDQKIKFSKECYESLPINWQLKERSISNENQSETYYELRLYLPFEQNKYKYPYHRAMLHAAILNSLLMISKWAIEIPQYNEDKIEVLK